MKSPTRTGRSEYEEKRSRFIGVVACVESEDEAKDFISSVKKQYHDARHNCWCYIIEGKAERYSDDGEPQGTAGIPMMEVLKREGVSNAVCVVTRYFGGILLGAGGLLRAYTKAAKDAVADSLPQEVIEYETVEFDCDYSDFEMIKSAISRYSGQIVSSQFGSSIRITATMPDSKEFSEKYLWKMKK